jgi:lauroyl/myristoyl acyltransferase
VTFINAAVNPMPIRNVIRLLKKNEIVFFASTGRGGKSSWHSVDFLGRKATFSPIPFKLAIKTRATLLPVFVLVSNPIARVVIDEPLHVADGDTPEKILEQYVSRLASYVKEYPDHFAIFLYEMHTQAGWDDHPFFSDYPKKMQLKMLKDNHRNI